jgi:hypothetical protein
MIFEARVTIDGSRAAVWSAMTDIESSPKIIRGIQSVEILERPATGLVGLKWRETRILFGKPAAVDKWITDAAPNEFYKTRAESDGSVFLSTMTISESGGIVTLSSSHVAEPQGALARVLSIPMGLLFKGMATKALQQDLDDIKAAVEQR